MVQWLAPRINRSKATKSKAHGSHFGLSHCSKSPLFPRKVIQSLSVLHPSAVEGHASQGMTHRSARCCVDFCETLADGAAWRWAPEGSSSPNKGCHVFWVQNACCGIQRSSKVVLVLDTKNFG